MLLVQGCGMDDHDLRRSSLRHDFPLHCLFLRGNRESAQLLAVLHSTVQYGTVQYGTVHTVVWYFNGMAQAGKEL